MASMFLIIQTVTRGETILQGTIQIWEGIVCFLWLFRDVCVQGAPLGISHRNEKEKGTSGAMPHVNENT